MSPLDSVYIAERLSRALDHNDFDTARLLLSPTCSYLIGDEEIVGDRAIIASYQTSNEWAEQHLDAVEYDSEVRVAGNGAVVITYVDRIAKGDWTHEHRCEQIIELSEDGLVGRIEHVDLDGERDSLEAFLQRCGLTRD